MKILKKKSIFAGVFTAIILTTTIYVGAMTSTLCGTLYTKNPLLSAPKGYAWTMGFSTCTAQCTASKDGVTNSQTVSKYLKDGGSIETDWISGPTYSSSGTTFSSVHTGYDDKGNYTVLTASKKY